MSQYGGLEPLEAALAEVGRGMTYAPAPDLGPAVLAALDQAGAPRSRFMPAVQGATARLVLMTALALVLLACAAAGAYYVSTQIRLTAETSIGTWVWTRIDGDETSLPFGRVNFVDGRYYVLEEPIHWEEDNVLPGGTWWVSDEGLTWRHEASGAPPGSLLEPRGADIWYAWPSPFGETEPVILRREGGEWVPAELPAAPAPEIAGMQWGSSFWNFVRSGEVTVALAPAAGSVDWQAVYGDLYFRAEWRDKTSGVLELSTFEDPWGDERELLAVLRMSVAGDPGEVDFHDYETGELVLRVVHKSGPWITSEQLGAQFRREEGFLVAYAWSLLVDDGEGYRLVKAPWQDLANTLLVNVAAGPGGFVAIAVDGVDAHAGDGKPLLYTWRSSDGEVWEEIGSPVPVPAGIAPFADLEGDDDEVFMVLHDDHNLRPSLWRLSESDWQQVEGVLLDLGMGGGMGAGPIRVEPGWALLAFRDDAGAAALVCEVWVSPDGEGWEQVSVAADLPPSIYQHDPDSLAPAGIAYSMNCGIAGDAVFAAWALEDGTRTLWMGRFEE